MTTFTDFPLNEGILKGLEEKGFTTPTPIQEKAIPYILKNEHDLIALAQTGTGKTAAFSLPVISKMEAGNNVIQTLILSPTRELAMQIADDIRSFTKYMHGIKTVTVYGGEPITKQIRGLKARPNIVVGTPGRMVDLIKRKVLKLDQVKWVVLDEADEMLNMGFKEDLNTILGNTPEEKQTLLFSATMSKEIERIAKTYMSTVNRIEVEATPTRERAITHQVMMVPSRERVAALMRYRALNPDMYGIIFCRTKRETQELGDDLLREGVATGVLHGDIEQKHRTRIMKAFKEKGTTLLVATDVAARGIDVSKLTHVIHMGVPDQVESYVHRSGRTGRANEEGISLVLAHMREHRALRQIEKHVGIRFQEVPAPTRDEIIFSEIDTYISKIETGIEASGLAKEYVEKLLEDVPKGEMEEVARRVLLVAIQGIVNKYPKKKQRIEERRERRGQGQGRGGRGGNRRGGRGRGQGRGGRGRNSRGRGGKKRG